MNVVQKHTMYYVALGEENISMSLVMTDSIHHKLQNMVLCDFQLMARVEVALNEIVGNVKYHGLCLLKQKQPEEPGTSNNKKNMMLYYNS